MLKGKSIPHLEHFVQCSGLLHLDQLLLVEDQFSCVVAGEQLLDGHLCSIGKKADDQSFCWAEVSLQIKRVSDEVVGGRCELRWYLLL